MSADHSTFDALLWEGNKNAKEQLLGLVHIPFVIIFPDAFLDASADPIKSREHVARVNSLLAESTTSMNDIPRMILALLMHSEQLKSIEDPWRWHTLGGQQLSQHFEFSPNSDISTFGIDSMQRIFTVGKDGAIVQTDEDVVAVADARGAEQGTSLMHPALALFSAFVGKYSNECYDQSLIRNRK